MTKKQAIQKSIDHWTRMIEWAKKQPRVSEADPRQMIQELHEWIGSSFCSLCQKYEKEQGTCISCPLCIKHGACGGSTNKNKWHDVAASFTWDQWVWNAKKFLKQLKSLL